MKTIIGFAFFSILGCATDPAIREARQAYQIASLKEQAAFDLECTADEIRVTRLAQYSFGVRGCGRKTAYLMARCIDFTETCTWMMNSPITKSSSPAASAKK